MSILSPLSSSPLTGEHLAELLASEAARDPYPHLLRWLIWFPLLSPQELTRLEQARLAKLGQTRSQSRIAAWLSHIETWQLIDSVRINELGWPPHQHRYLLTDAGLYLFAALVEPPLSVKRLAQAYPVERTDLLARLARLDIHLVLAAFASRLLAEGEASGLSLVSYQQPWRGSVTGRGTLVGQRPLTAHCDAAFLLAKPEGTEHGFLVWVDTNERVPFDRTRTRMLLLRLLMLRHALSLARETMPPLLLITGLSRLAAWSTLLEQVSVQQQTALLEGAMTTLEALHTHGVYGLIWWSFADLVCQVEDGKRDTLSTLPTPTASLAQLLGKPVSQRLAESFSQRATFAHLLSTRTRRSWHRAARALPTYVGPSLARERFRLAESQRALGRWADVLEAFSGTLSEQREATALLNLTLSATQKDLLCWLTHHPLLTLHHLATLHDPGIQDRRGVQRQVSALVAWGLLLTYTWSGARHWSERERYLLSEPALRYSALREGKAVTYYLCTDKACTKETELTSSALWVQQGVAGLFAQMEHTHGLYHCMTRILVQAHTERIRCVAWHNAHEAIRRYRDPFTAFPMQVRPDAEVIYQLEEQPATSMLYTPHPPRRILVEYDRATTGVREIEGKYQGYVDYQEATGLVLPPLLVITQHAQAAARLRRCLSRIGATLSVLVILEEQVQQPGLFIQFAQLDRAT